MNIRPASSYDAHTIRKIHLAAFPQEEAGLVAKLATDLLSEQTTPPTISLLVESNNSAIGHVAFSPVTIDNNRDFQGYILAPLAVVPDYQKHGIGSKLVEAGIEQLSDTNTHIIFVYGDPRYYSRFGFTAETAEHFITPYRLEYPAGWQALILKAYASEDASITINCVRSLQKPALW
ncbi:MAG: N-acetyltransferase [Gammaproteobacteria bacterium]|nr:N-acetyltransferase [Gammaproteobacteria bacterium]NNJ90452.1 N-acetyltransferase [Gammaproteobacteria bacterium]